MHPILITGSTGLVGCALVPALAANDIPLVLTHRREQALRSNCASNIFVGEIGPHTLASALVV